MKACYARFSCGALELYELSNYYQIERRDIVTGKNPTSKELVDFALKEAAYGRPPFIVFSDNIDESRAGICLAEYIIKNKLGAITQSPIGYNRAHHSNIRIWIWTIDWANV